MDWKMIAMIGGIILAVALLAFVLFPKPCDYENFAWGHQKNSCTCLGVKIDSSCKVCSAGECSPCPDAGASTGCSGLVTARTCYRFGYANGTEAAVQVPC